VEKVCKSKDSQEDVQIVENKSDEDKSDEDKSDEDKSDEDKSDEDKSDEDKSDEDKSDEDKSDDKSDEDLLLTTSCVTTNKSSRDWIIDRGCTNHMTHDTEIFKELNKSNISKNLLSVAQLLEKGYKVSFENKVYVIKNANNIKVFKVHMKDKRFALDFMKEEFATKKVSMKEGSKLEDKYLWKKVDVQVKKVDGSSHSNIHKRSNATLMKSTPDKEKDDADIRKNMKDDAKLKKDVMPWLETTQFGI